MDHPVMPTSHARRSLPQAWENVSWLLGLESLPGHVDPDSAALQWTGGSRTYAQLRASAISLADSLSRAGLLPGDRVASHLFNRGETFELYFACAYAGLTLVPISFRLTSREIGLVLDDATPRAIFTQAELESTLRVALEELAPTAPDVLVVLGDEASGSAYDALAGREDVAEFEPRHTEIQMILYTSGTTGRPKGVEMRHRNAMWCALQQALYYGMNASTVTMITGPMYNTAAMNEQSIPTFAVGGCVTIMPSRGWTPSSMSALIDRWRVTHALIYPSMIEPMLGADETDPIDLATMHFALTGGENCPPETMRRFRERWPHVSLCIAYGSTESGIVSLLRDDEIAAHVGSVGRAAGAQVVLVVDNDGHPLPKGQVGRVWTAGPSIVSGYWRAPELTAGALRDGWLDMGDLGRMDDAGYLYISGRTKDMIISKGQNIYPAEIENAIREHPLVSDVAVVGVPDADAGEAVCAVVVRKHPDLTSGAVTAFVKERIASYKKPRYVVFESELPRSPAGKVLKPELLERVLKTLLKAQS
tara:strand:+ start:15322 stop:16923 length:1602 start_codon:yes stop_codon:yes gene_type:complete